MTAFNDVTGAIAGFLWGPAMLILLMGGGLYLTFRLRFVQFRYFGYMMRQTAGSMFGKKSKAAREGAEGTITPFQAVTTALASTVGAANIVGVPVAVAFGGPGAIFWMWITALIGMATKYAEIVLGVRYREKNSDGEFVGGPQYYLKNGLKSKALGVSYAFIFMLTIFFGIMVQSNSAAGSAATLGVPEWASGAVMVLLVGLIVVGGVKRVGRISEKFVPFMASLYMLGALIIIFMNAPAVPAAFLLIFRDAFTGHAAAGGFAGATLVAALRWGVARGAYSNEAGMGSAPIAHSAATTDHPVRQGLWGMFEVAFDTLLICTVTGLLIIVSGQWLTEAEPSGMTALAFGDVFGPVGSSVVSLSLLLFVISTVYVIAFYGQRLAAYLFGKTFSKVVVGAYLVAIMIGSLGGLKQVWVMLDIFFGLAVIPNMIGVLGLSGVVAALTKEYFNTSGRFYQQDKELAGKPSQ